MSRLNLEQRGTLRRYRECRQLERELLAAHGGSRKRAAVVAAMVLIGLLSVALGTGLAEAFP